MRRQLGAALRWAVAAVLSGLAVWGIMMFPIYAFSPMPSAGGAAVRSVGFAMAMIYAGSGAIVIGLPATIVTTFIWGLVAWKIPRLDSSLASIAAGSVLIASAVALTYFRDRTATWGFDSNFIINSFLMFVVVATGLVRPRKLCKSLHPGVFA